MMPMEIPPTKLTRLEVRSKKSKFMDISLDALYKLLLPTLLAGSLAKATTYTLDIKIPKPEAIKTTPAEQQKILAELADLKSQRDKIESAQKDIGIITEWFGRVIIRNENVPYLNTIRARIKALEGQIYIKNVSNETIDYINSQIEYPLLLSFFATYLFLLKSLSSWFINTRRERVNERRDKEVINQNFEGLSRSIDDLTSKLNTLIEEVSSLKQDQAIKIDTANLGRLANELGDIETKLADSMKKVESGDK